jgi:hypothetical protein
MAECQSSSVKGLSRGDLLDPVGRPPLSSRDAPASTTAIHRVSHHRVSHVLQMDPYLVGATGVQLQPEEVDHGEPGHHRGLGPGGSTGGRDDHPLSIARMTRHRCIDLERTGVQVTPGQRRIGSADPPGRDGGSQPAVSHIGLGHEHETRCVTVQPVNDAGPSFGTPGQRGAPRDEGIDQGIVPVSGSGVHHQTGRFIDDSEVLVLKHNGERNGTRVEGTRRLMLRETHGDLLTAGEDSGRATWLPINADQLISYEAGRLSAREFELVCEEPI